MSLTWNAEAKKVIHSLQQHNHSENHITTHIRSDFNQ